MIYRINPDLFDKIRREKADQRSFGLYLQSFVFKKIGENGLRHILELVSHKAFTIKSRYYWSDFAQKFKKDELKGTVYFFNKEYLELIEETF